MDPTNLYRSRFPNRRRGSVARHAVSEIVVTVDAATVVGRLLDALTHDPDAGPPLRDLLDVDAGASTTGLAVRAPAMLGVESIGRWRPTYDEHEAIRHAIVEAGMNVCEAFDRRCAERRGSWRGAAPTTMVELVESRIHDVIPGDQ